jgi:hypothetical protein
MDISVENVTADRRRAVATRQMLQSIENRKQPRTEP